MWPFKKKIPVRQIPSLEQLILTYYSICSDFANEEFMIHAQSRNYLLLKAIFPTDRYLIRDDKCTVFDCIVNKVIPKPTNPALEVPTCLN